MRKPFLILLLLLVGFGLYWFVFKKKTDRGPRQQPLKVGKHSQKFNQSIADVMNAYFGVHGSFVDADTNGAKSNTTKFITTLDSIHVEELKKDTAGIYESAVLQIGDIKANAKALLMETGITEMRMSYRDISENLYPFLKTINYEGPVVYWQNCGMPFGENTSANWLSKTYEIVNPYLGKNHPQWKSAMLHCGEVMDSIFTK